LIGKIARNSFKSTNIKSSCSRNYAVTDDLTIRGVTKSVTLAMEDVSMPSNDPWEHQGIALSGSAKVNRKDEHMWNTALESGVVPVGDEVTITLDVKFVK
jgi:polyisoprenoid-binding protein YceI